LKIEVSGEEEHLFRDGPELDPNPGLDVLYHSVHDRPAIRHRKRSEDVAQQANQRLFRPILLGFPQVAQGKVLTKRHVPSGSAEFVGMLDVRRFDCPQERDHEVGGMWIDLQ
jgi:hypothetical protein